MPLSHLFSHVDLRVREAERSVRFYDALFASLGLRRRPGGDEFVSWSRPEDGDDAAQWLGFTVDPQMVAGSARICFSAADRAEVDRVAEAARRAGALHFEPPHEAYGSDYYAAFFEDPDGNRLEIACFVE